jgi:hypothetical protein
VIKNGDLNVTQIEPVALEFYECNPKTFSDPSAITKLRGLIYVCLNFSKAGPLGGVDKLFAPTLNEIYIDVYQCQYNCSNHLIPLINLMRIYYGAIN